QSRAKVERAGRKHEPHGRSQHGSRGHRQRFLTPEEAERLVGSIHADRNQIAAKAIMLLLLTGARRREVTRARWEDVDWEKRTPGASLEIGQTESHCAQRCG